MLSVLLLSASLFQYHPFPPSNPIHHSPIPICLPLLSHHHHLYHPKQRSSPSSFSPHPKTSIINHIPLSAAIPFPFFFLLLPLQFTTNKISQPNPLSFFPLFPFATIPLFSFNILPTFIHPFLPLTHLPHPFSGQVPRYLPPQTFAKTHYFCSPCSSFLQFVLASPPSPIIPFLHFSTTQFPSRHRFCSSSPASFLPPFIPLNSPVSFPVTLIHFSILLFHVNSNKRI